jgi:long-chain fatty acid transport protein
MDVNRVKHVLIVACIFFSTGLQAGGFANKERSTTAQGMSFSGVSAGAGDVSYALFNPAALSEVEDRELAGTFTLVVPDWEATARFNGQTDTPGVTTPLTSAAYGHRISEGTVVGLGLYVPFGLVTEYESDFIGAFDGILSELYTLALSPMVSIDFTPNLSVGAAMAIIYNDPQLTGAAGINPNTGEVLEVKLNASEFEYSWAMGFLWDMSETTTLGGRIDTGYDITTGGILSAFDQNFAPIELFGEASINLPLTIGLGMQHQVSEKLTLNAEVEYANWAEFDEIRVDVAALGANSNVGEVTNYKDSMFFAAGLEYSKSDALTLRAGLAYDETPTQDDGRSSRVPDADRVWISSGFSYQKSENLSIDAAYSLILFDDPEVTLLNGPAAGTKVDYSGPAHIVSIGLNYRF